MNKDKLKAARIVSDYLDRINYKYMCLSVIPNHDLIIHPTWHAAQQIMGSLGDPMRATLHMLRFGREMDCDLARVLFPLPVLDSLVELEFLEINEKDQYLAKNLGIVPLNDLYLVASLHQSYPSNSDSVIPVYLGHDTTYLIWSMPPQISGKALDICGGSGVQGMSCARRGAESVVILEKNPEAIAIAEVNLMINGLQDVCEIRESDLFSALEADETFDFIVSNPPFMPIYEGFDFPIAGAGGNDGTLFLKQIFEAIPDRLNEGGKARVVSNILGSDSQPFTNTSYLPALASEKQVGIMATFKDPLPKEGYKKNVKMLLKSLDQSLHRFEDQYEDWMNQLTENGVAHNYIYMQITHFDKGLLPGFRSQSLVRPGSTDTLSEYMRTAVYLN